MRRSPFRFRRWRRLVAAAAMAPLVAWSLSSVGAAAPGLCHLLMEISRDHACCASHAGPETASPEGAAAVETCHAPVAPAPEPARAEGTAVESPRGDAVAAADCACVPMDESRRDGARETSVTLENAPPRHEFAPVTTVLTRAALVARAGSGVLKYPEAERPMAGGSPLFILFDVLLI